MLNRQVETQTVYSDKNAVQLPQTVSVLDMVLMNTPDPKTDKRRKRERTVVDSAVVDADLIPPGTSSPIKFVCGCGVDASICKIRIRAIPV
jgi:hypothetical protein